MTHNIHTLIIWIRVVAMITSCCVTSFPVIYGTLFPWRHREIGKLIMFYAVSVAIIIDLSTLFSFWRPSDILVVFWIDALVLTLVAVSTSLITLFMLRIKFPSRKGKSNEREGLQRS